MSASSDRYFARYEGAIQNRALTTVLIPALVLIATGALAIELHPVLQGEVSSGLIFVLGIVIVGATCGLGSALVTSVIASVIFNFILAEPTFALRISDGKDLAAPLIFTACAVISGLLAGRLRDQSFVLDHSNAQLERLFETSRRLQSATDAQAVALSLQETISTPLGVTALLFLFHQGELRPVLHSTDPAIQKFVNITISTETVSESELGFACQLVGTRSRVGAIFVGKTENAVLDANFVAALSGIVALAVERAELVSVVAKSDAESRTRELKNALLSSVSHDLRTPLAIIIAASSSLKDFGDQLDEKTSRDLLENMNRECFKLNRYTSNLLDMSRLEAGPETLQARTISAAEAVANAVDSCKLRYEDRTIDYETSNENLTVCTDAAMFELALTNIVENALKYSETEKSVSVKLAKEDSMCTVQVTDDGPGIPSSEQTRVFERFYRSKAVADARQGSGLGLAIAKGFVEAFDGSITLHSPVKQRRGTQVTIRLPLSQENLPI